MNLTRTPRLAILIVGLMICCATSWANANDYSGTIKTTANCDLNFTTELIGVFCNEDKGDIVVHITGGTAPFQVEWDNHDFSIWAEVEVAGNSYTIKGIPSGVYKIQVRDAFGCLQKQEACLKDQESTMELSVTNNSSSCDTEGSIAVVVGNSAPPYWVTLDGPTPQGHIMNESVFTLDGLAGGEYTVKVRQEKCEATSTIKVTTNTSSLALQVHEVASCAGSFAAVATNITGGHPNYRLYYDGPTSGLTQSYGPKLVQNLAAGTYKFTVIDQEGCTVSQEVEVGDNNHADVHFYAYGYPGACGKMGHIGIEGMTGSAPYELSWHGPRSSSVMMNDGDAYNIEELPAGLYEVRMKDVFGCIYKHIVEVHGGSDGMHFDADAHHGHCGERGYVSVHGMNGTAPYHLSWSGPTSNSVTMDHAGSYDIKDLLEGDYELTMSDANGCIYIYHVHMDGGDAGISMTSEATADPCTGTGDIWVTPIEGTGSYTLTWTGPTTGSVGIGANGYSIAGVPSGNYHLTLTDQNGCSTSQDVAFNITTSNVSMTSEATANLCNQTGDIWVTPIGGTGSYTLLWTGPTQGNVSIGPDGYSIVGVPSGKYHLTVSDQNGCSTTQDVEFNITTSLLKYDLSSVNAVNGQNGSINVAFGNGVQPYTVSWSGPVSNSIRTNGPNYNIVNLPAGTYSITVTDSDGCFHVEQITVANSARITNLNFSAEPSDQVGSNGGSIRVLVLQGSGPYTISWSGPSSGTIRTDNIEYFIRNLSAGTYSITVTDRDGNYGTKTVVVSYRADTSFAINVGVTNSVCNNNGSIDASWQYGVAPYQVSWTGSSSGAISTNNSSYSVSLPAGNYIATITDARGESKSAVANIGVSNGTLYCSLNPMNAICTANGSLFVVINGGTLPYQLRWEGPSSGAVTVYDDYNIPNLPPGTYTTYLSDAGGCAVSEAAVVGVSPSNLGLTINGGDGKVDFLFGSGTPNYNITLSGPMTVSQVAGGNTTISGLAGGLYRATIVDANGCSLSQLVRVTGDNAMPGETQFVSNFTSTQTTISEKNSLLELENRSILTLNQNYPNPSSTFTTIPFNLVEAMKVSMTIQDRFGKIVKELHQTFDAGNNQIEINSNDLPTGIYYYTLVAGAEMQTKRMVIAH